MLLWHKNETLHSLNLRIMSKNLDNMRLLISHPAFQKRVKEIRKKLHIPDEGIQGNKENEKWRELAAKRDREIQNTPDFLEKCKKLYALQERGAIGEIEEHPSYEDLTKDISYYYQARSVRALLDEFNVPLNYELSVEAYIRGGKIGAPKDNFSATITKRRCLPITFYTKPTDDDLRKLKKYINKYFGEKLPFVQNTKNISKKLEVEMLYKNREEIDSVTQETYQLTNADISDRVYGDRDKEHDVYEDVRSLNSLRKRRFTPRKSMGQ